MPEKMLERMLESLVKWTQIPKDQKEIILQELENTIPRIGFEELELRLKEKSNLDQSEIRKLIGLIITIFLNYYETDRSIDEFTKEIMNEFENFEKFKLEIKDKISNFIYTILKMEQNLGIMAKAISVMSDHAHTFNRSRILTDLRPIYMKDIQESPKNAVIIHNLKILAREDGKFIEFFVAMDSKDLLELKKIIERAQLKEKSLRQLCKLKDIKILEVI